MALVRTVLAAPAVTNFNSLASSLTAVASSAAITVGASTNVADHEIMVTITGPASMVASTTTVVNLFAYASNDGINWGGSNTTNELIDGTDKAITWSANGNQAIYIGKVVMSTSTTGTSIVYRSARISMAAVFGGSMPAKYVIVPQNQSGAALPASGHSILIDELSFS